MDFSGCYKPTPLKINLVLEIRLASKQVGEVLLGKTSGYLFSAGISSKDLASMLNTIGFYPLSGMTGHSDSFWVREVYHLVSTSYEAIVSA